MDSLGFKEEDITVLMDDGSHQNPTYDNILAAFGQLVTQTKAGDCAFLHYSGKFRSGYFCDVCLWPAIANDEPTGNLFDRTWRTSQG